MDIEKLIAGLSKEAYGSDLEELLLESTTALSTLQAENEKLREKIEDARLEGYAKGLGEMSAELEQVKRERDAIEQDFRAFAKQWWEQDSGFPCRWCKFENYGGCEWKVKHRGEICAGRAFEWCGQKED